MTSSYSKTSVSPVHTNTINLRFQKSPLWRAFLKTSVFSDRKRRIRVDGRLKRRKKAPFSKISGYVLTRPQSFQFYTHALQLNGFPKQARKIDNNLSIYKINKLHHGTCFVRFFFHSLSCIRKLTRSFSDTTQLVNKNRTRIPGGEYSL